MQGQSAASVAEAALYWVWGYALPNMAKAAASTGIQRNAINKLSAQSSLVSTKNQEALGIVTPNADTLYQTGWLGERLLLVKLAVQVLVMRRRLMVTCFASSCVGRRKASVGHV